MPPSGIQAPWMIPLPPCPTPYPGGAQMAFKMHLINFFNDKVLVLSKPREKVMCFVRHVWQGGAQRLGEKFLRMAYL